MVEVNLINDSTGEIFTTIKLEDETVEKIKSLGMTIEEGINAAFNDIIKNPEYYKKIVQVDKKMKK
jgi:hypothetical protein